MSLPTYQTIIPKTTSTDELEKYLNPELNLRNPVVFDLRSFKLEDQLEIMGIIQNYFYSQNIPHQFPYGVYFISHHDKTVAKISIVNQPEELPAFFNSRKNKLNMKESHLIDKNKILQQDVLNTGLNKPEEELMSFGENHKKVFQLEQERKFYHIILKELI